MNVAQLRAECASLGIDAEGTKTQLKKRLKRRANGTSIAAAAPICQVFLTAKSTPRRCRNLVLLSKSKLYCRFHLGNGNNWNGPASSFQKTNAHAVFVHVSVATSHAWRSKRQLDYARLILCAAPAGIHLFLTGGCACVQEEQQQILTSSPTLLFLVCSSLSYYALVFQGST